jgi:hypothetical protein
LGSIKIGGLCSLRDYERRGKWQMCSKDFSTRIYKESAQIIKKKTAFAKWPIFLNKKVVEENIHIAGKQGEIHRLHQ